MDNRREPRFDVEGVQGKLTFAPEVEILNMSLSGVALKLDRRLNIGSEYTLKLDVDGNRIPVKGIIVWSALDEVRKQPNGEETPIYSAGLRFTDVVTPPMVQLLEFIDRHKLVPDKRLGGVRFSINASGKALLDVLQPYGVKVISLRGMLIESERPLEKEARCSMEMSVDKGVPLRFEGRVVFCDQVSEGPPAWNMGIEFLEMPAADRTRLDGYIRALGGH